MGHSVEIKLSKLLPDDFDDIRIGIDFAIARLRPLVEGDVERRQKEVMALKMLKNVYSSIFPAQIKLRFEGVLDASREIEAAKKRMCFRRPANLDVIEAAIKLMDTPLRLDSALRARQQRQRPSRSILQRNNPRLST